MSLLLLYSGAQLGAAPDLFANASGFLTLTGHATAQLAADWGPPGGAGREEFQPQYRRRVRREITAEARGVLELRGRATAHIQPAVVAGGALPKPTPRIRPPEEEREFRILAKARGKLHLEGTATAYTRVLAAGWAELTLGGTASAETSWPDDTAELVAIMLMLDQEAA